MILFNIEYFPFPDDIHEIMAGMVWYDENIKRFCIAIDSRRSKEQQLFTLKHEYAHVMIGHLNDSSKPTLAKEVEADYYANNMTESVFNILMSLSRIRSASSLNFENV